MVEQPTNQIDPCMVSMCELRFRNTNNILILGDLNADCSYLPQSKMSQVILRNDSRFHWLIADDVDTTVSNTDCAYDRSIFVILFLISEFIKLIYSFLYTIGLS